MAENFQHLLVIVSLMGAKMICTLALIHALKIAMRFTFTKVICQICW